LYGDREGLEAAVRTYEEAALVCVSGVSISEIEINIEGAIQECEINEVQP
jgi:hypothetical protein